MNISHRIKTIASFVTENSKVINIGSDHALLEIYLVKTKKPAKVIASDINPNALKQGLTNINKYQVANKIILREEDGLKAIDPDIDTVIISGLGGSTICRILTTDKALLKNVKHIILQPNSDLYEVRKKVVALGYVIDEEEILTEKKHTYIILSFKKGSQKYSHHELYFGPKLMAIRPHLLNTLVKKRKKRLLIILKKVPLTHPVIKLKLLKELKMINYYLKAK